VAGAAKVSAEGANSGAQQTAIAGTKPNDVASAQEWQEALWEASQVLRKVARNSVTNVVGLGHSDLPATFDRQKHVELQIEMKDLFDRHPDAKELDEIGMIRKQKRA